MIQCFRVFSVFLISFLAYQVVCAFDISSRNCPSPWQSAIGNSTDCNYRDFFITTWSPWTGYQKEVRAKIRSGYLAENPKQEFRGNIIYYQGLGDSMLNHMPLFERLTKEGYRVIAFDYMGQGGSSGSMNDTRIFEIGTLGEKIWNIHGRDLRDYPVKNIIGWSTGGLAAYLQSLTITKKVNLVLIAPGISPEPTAGEYEISKFKFGEITISSLTSESYLDGTVDPHMDPIKPKSPLEVKAFAWDLIVSSLVTRIYPMSKNVSGLVLLSGENDSYVDAQSTREILSKKAKHFTVIDYPLALHEIDNEAEPTRSRAHQDIVNFLNKQN